LGDYNTELKGKIPNLFSAVANIVSLANLDAKLNDFSKPKTKYFRFQVSIGLVIY
jgi:hypothetical protein